MYISSTSSNDSSVVRAHFYITNNDYTVIQDSPSYTVIKLE